MALKFNGTTQYVDCGNGTSLQITGDVSVSAWLMVEQDWVPSHNQYHNVAVKGSVFNLGYGLIVYERQTGTKTHPQFFVRNSSGYVTTGLDFYVPNNWGVNNWVHLVGTFSSSAGRIRLYEAGVMVAEVSTTLYPSSTTDHFYLARPADSYATTDKFFKGHLADVRVYNRELTPEEAAEIYHKRGADRVWQGIVGWWKLDELTSGTPAPLLLDAMDATTGWSAKDGAELLVNNTTYTEGSRALNLSKKSTAINYCVCRKGSVSFNVTNQTIKISVYIKDATVKSKLSQIVVELWSTLGSASYQYYPYVTDLEVGTWNTISEHIDNFTVNGSPSKSSITNIDFGYRTQNTSDTFSSGDIIFDFYRAGDYPLTIPDLSGNGNHGTPYNSPIYRESPHRLRRGVIIT